MTSYGIAAIIIFVVFVCLGAIKRFKTLVEEEEKKERLKLRLRLEQESRLRLECIIKEEEKRKKQEELKWEEYLGRDRLRLEEEEKKKEHDIALEEKRWRREQNEIQKRELKEMQQRELKEMQQREREERKHRTNTERICQERATAKRIKNAIDDAIDDAVITTAIKVSEVVYVGDRSKSDAPQCVACQGADSDHTFIPCGHMCVCGNCARILKARGDVCPICRIRPESIVKIFR